MSVLKTVKIGPKICDIMETAQDRM